MTESAFVKEIKMVRSVSMRILGQRGVSHCDAEDLFQQAVYKAYKNLDKFRHGSKFSSWFLRILLNSWISKIRSDKVRPVVVQTSNVPDEYYYVKDKDSIKEFDELEASLSLPDSDLLKMLYDGNGYRDIARQLDLPLGTVKSKISRERERVRQDYDARLVRR